MKGRKYMNLISCVLTLSILLSSCLGGIQTQNSYEDEKMKTETSLETGFIQSRLLMVRTAQFITATICRKAMMAVKLIL